MYPATQEGSFWDTSMNRQANCITEKQSREIKAKQGGFPTQVPIGYSLSSVWKLTAPPSSQPLSGVVQTSLTQTFSLLKRNEEAADPHLFKKRLIFKCCIHRGSLSLLSAATTAYVELQFFFFSVRLRQSGKTRHNWLAQEEKAVKI